MPEKNPELEKRVLPFLDLFKVKRWDEAIDYYNTILDLNDKAYLKSVYLGPVVTAFKEYRLLHG